MRYSEDEASEQKKKLLLFLTIRDRGEVSSGQDVSRKYRSTDAYRANSTGFCCRANGGGEPLCHAFMT